MINKMGPTMPRKRLVGSDVNLPVFNSNFQGGSQNRPQNIDPDE